MARPVKVAPLDEISPGTGRAVEIDGRAVALFRLGDEVHAIDGLCPHQYHPLHEGELCDATITCPLHGWCFDVRTGGPPGQPDLFPRVDRFKVTIEDGWVWVDPTPL